MTHSSDRASSARNKNANPNKENTAMRNYLPLMVMALVAPILTPACSEAPAGVSTPPEVTLKVLYTEDCEDDAVKDELGFCTTPLEATRKMMVGDTDGDASKEVDVQTLEIGRLAGQLEAEDVFAPYPIEAGQYAEMHFSFNVAVPDGYELQSCDGGPRPSVVRDLDVEEICVKFAKTDNGGTGGNTGSGKGDICVNIEDEDGNPVDVSDCVVKLDGKAVSGDEDTEMLCEDGLFLDRIDAKTYTVDVACTGDLEGEDVIEVIEDDHTDVTVVVEEDGGNTDPPSDDGAVCISVKDEQNNPLGNCTFDWLQIAANDEPMASNTPPGSCNSAGDYYFEVIPAGNYDVMASCGGLSGQRDVNVVAEEEQHVWMTLLAPVPDGDLCVGKLGLPIDLDTPDADMALWLGYGSGGMCAQASPQEAAGMFVVDFSQTFSSEGSGSCTDKNDPNCAIVANDLVISMTNGFNGYAANEQRVFEVVVEDGNANQVSVYIDTLNDYFQ